MKELADVTFEELQNARSNGTRVFQETWRRQEVEKA